MKKTVTREDEKREEQSKSVLMIWSQETRQITWKLKEKTTFSQQKYGASDR